jgi:putative transposase
MNDDRVVLIGSQSAPCDVLTELLREKAVELLQAAVNAECADFLNRFAEQRDHAGRSALVRNGYLPARSIVTGIGAVSVTVPRVRDRTGQGIRFESKLVPAYVRRAQSIDAVLPWLYLRGISQADRGPALEALVGKDVANLSGAVVGKLKRRWGRAVRCLAHSGPVEKALGVCVGRRDLLRHPRRGPEAVCVDRDRSQ